MSANYLKLTLSLAIEDCFLRGKGDARSRLVNGFKHHLSKLREEDFSAEQWIVFSKIHDRLTRHGPKMMHGRVYVGAYDNGRLSLRNKTAAKFIGMLVDMHNKMQIET